MVQPDCGAWSFPQWDSKYGSKVNSTLLNKYHIIVRTSVAGAFGVSFISQHHTPFLYIPAGSAWDSFQRLFWPRSRAQQRSSERARGSYGRGAALINDGQHWWLNILVALFLGWDNTETVSQNRPGGLGHKVLQGPQPYAAPSLLCFISLSLTNATWAHSCYPPNRSTSTFVQDLLLKELNLVYNPSSESWKFDIGIGNGNLVKYH